MGTVITGSGNLIKKSDHNELEKIEIELLLEGIYRYYGLDFRNYAFPFVQRRIWHRIHAEKLKSISGLQERVFHDSAIMKKLFVDFSINVTEMFRDPSFFLSLRNKVIPLMKDYPYIRIWHVGCASGEEVYSMAILLLEEGLYDKAKIYATDINAGILEKAKQGVFPLDRMQAYTKNYFRAGGKRAFSEYYTIKEEQVIFHPFLRENIVFAQHNLVTDHSFNEFHIIVCRNVMIYFNKSLQNHVHGLLYESLGVEGFLGLGKREGVRFTSHADFYDEFDSEERLYRKRK
ncbi:MAG TPA: protein-glutamate O-methyltransferase CheR [Bacillus sp. (in: firmicutes)]|nr:protein-glutamate O-methyltransferase CheR [Bacillus sp. (in: firmicutes)]